MMDDGMEDVDGDVLAGLSSVPPRRKIQSFSQQLGSNSGGDRTHRYHHPHSRRSRKHSLEENRFPNSTIDHFLDSSDDEFFSSSPGYFTTTTSAAVSTRQQKQQEYTTAFLDRKPSSSSSSSTSTTTTTTTTDDQRHHQVPIPEFVASGGSKGIFKVPNRRAMHPNRPPSIELRPHPLRETQLGSFLRVIACTDSHLWAGQESGLRYWNFSDAYAIPFPTTTLRAGDDAAAPFHDSTPTSPTLCLILDMANRLVWTGHQDGKIKMWNMDQTQHPFKEILTWRALRGPILSLAISSYGDLWSGSEGGMIKVWPWETIEKSFSLTENERHMASLLVERSYIDLRSVNGVSSMSSSDVKYLLSDNSRAKVWSAGNLSFALWDARTRDLLKMFNMEGQIENRIDIAPGQDPPVEEEMKVKLVSTSKKDKPQNSLSFLQRSRNALMGAADAVRRAATKGTFGEENRRTEALVLTADGMIWTGCTNGLLLQWDGNGNRLQDFKHHHSSVQCLCTFGARIWVGYVTGTVQVLDLDGNLLGGWVAHDSPIIKLAVGAGYVFTLANHGGIRGWNITSPGPLDNILRSEVARQQLLYTKLENLKILIGTWNVGQGRASHDSLILWLGSAASDVGLVVVGLQEVEMGAGFLAMSAARESVGLEGSSIGQWWLDTIGKNLDEGTTFERIGSRQLAGLLIAAWVRKNLRPYVGDVDAAAVPCGLGRAIGNKGAVGLRIRVYDRIMCFVNCHLAAHLEAINRRNADFDHIFRNMMFNRPNLLNAAADSVSSGTQMLRSTNTVGIHSEDGKPELSEADMVVFLGDFNYRLYGITYEEAKDFVSQRCFDWLRERDQLRAEMKAGKVFQGMREGVVTFPPTYKFEKHQPGLGGYDSSEKKRIPAWCDRIVYRDSRSSSVSECSLDCPVVSSILQYEACMDVTDSDHKPVRCILNFDIACIDEPIRRREFGEAIVSDGKIRSLLEELHEVPETSVDTNNLILQNQDQSILRISNKCDKDKAFFQIICESESTVKEVGQASEDCPRGSFGFPRWLEVTPAVGVIRPGQATEVLVNYEVHTLEEFVDGIPQNWWCEDTRDKEVILVLSVRGSLSTATRCHKIHVRHHFEPNNNKSKCNNSTRTQRSNVNGNSSSDADSRHAMIHFL